MNDLQRQRIKKLRQQGVTYSKIAELLGLKPNSVKSYCQRNGITPSGEVEAPGAEDSYCRNCGIELFQVQGRKPRRFCCDGCRVLWWKVNPSRTPGATYHFTCPGCGIPFSAYGNAGRKYCTHACYVKARFGKAVAA